MKIENEDKKMKIEQNENRKQNRKIKKELRN